MDNSTKATITWLVGLLLMGGLFFLGLLSLQGEQSLSLPFLIIYGLITYAALYGADQANQMAEQIPNKLPAVTVGGGGGESGSGSDESESGSGGSDNNE